MGCTLISVRCSEISGPSFTRTRAQYETLDTLKHDKETDLSGKKVGEYDVLAQVGVGGMGVVYSGLQPMIGKKVAIKVLLPHLSSEPELVGRFLSEARAVNAIGHRGIVDIFSFGELPGGPHYFVMEFLEGTSFDRLIKERGALPPYDVLMWISEVLDALGAAIGATAACAR